MSVYFLGSNDFDIVDGQLFYKNAKPELTLILFYSPDCPHCGPILPLIQQLSARLHGCKYALINVKENYAAVAKSKDTSTPVTYVPTILLYYNGRPFQRYGAAYTLDNLKNFILEAAKTVRNSFNKVAPPAAQKEVPSFTTGVPYCDDENGVCYLDFERAYGSRA